MVDALLALAKVPAPPVHVPLPLVVADILIGVMPHTAYGPLASAIADWLTVIVKLSLEVQPFISVKE